MAFIALDMGNKAYAASIMFMLGAVQAQLLRKLQFGGAAHGKPLSSKNRTEEHKRLQQQCQTK